MLALLATTSTVLLHAYEDVICQGMEYMVRDDWDTNINLEYKLDKKPNKRKLRHLEIS